MTMETMHGSIWKRNLYVSWFTQILALTGFGFVFPFLPFFIQELGVTEPAELRLWTGILSSAPALSMGVMAPIWGIIADRYGKKPMILRAMIGGAVVTAAMSLAGSVQMVLALRIVQGAFSGTMAASAALIATHTPKERLASSLGLLSSSNFIGMSLGPLVGGIASEAFGYRNSFVIGAITLLLGAVLVLALIHEPRPTVELEPAPHPVRAPGSTILSRLRTLITPSMLTLLVTLLVIRFVKALPVPFLPLHVQELRGTLEGSASATGLLSAARGAATALSAVTITRLGDRIPKLKLVAWLVAIGALLSAPLAFTPGLWSFSIVLVVGTYFLGGIEPLIQADLSSRTPANRRGLLFGVQTTVGNVGWFLAPLFGSVVSIRYGIPAVFVSLTIFLVVTTGLTALISGRPQPVAGTT
ncbi:MAG: MFS transporter [Spirochaetaceae bacterium]|nr:MAG: MFS transporter [Spirochaetaceae bacterium]